MVITVILFSIGIALVVGVIVPLVNHAKGTGQRAYQIGSGVPEDLENILK